MVNSLGEYNIARSSSADMNNIKWTQRHPAKKEKSMNQKKLPGKITSFNIIYDQNSTSQSAVKNFFVMNNTKSKNKKKTHGKKFQTASASNYIIKQGFTRPAR